MGIQYNTVIFICSFVCVLFIIFYSLIYNYYYLPHKRNEMNKVYKKLYEKIKRKKYITSLCKEMRCFLSKEELDVVYVHFKSNKPSIKINKDFYDNKNYIGRHFWWRYDFLNKEEMLEVTHQRKLFILKMIELTDKK